VLWRGALHCTALHCTQCSALHPLVEALVAGGAGERPDPAVQQGVPLQAKATVRVGQGVCQGVSGCASVCQGVSVCQIASRCVRVLLPRTWMRV
jgi:hypothetical protein